MKTTEVNKKIIGRRCKCIFTGLLVTGVIEDTTEDKYMVSVKVRFDTPHQWGDELYSYDWSFGRKADDFGSLKYLELLPDKTTFDAMIVTFGEPIDTLNDIFEDVKAWGVCSLKGWIDSYESTRFTPIDVDKAVITSEYNMECVKEWLEHNTPVKNIIIG
ncbi:MULTISPECIES: DUF6956 domain-containing protein [Bacteroidales]|uniref:DUF7258 domain-containing protein n=1 Tax=Bacteroidales TaxID=171549 RepID=UPI000EFEC8D2|nr:MULTISPECIES: hypothetical protein [Parabacteroides]RHO65576.1 hypothetical protein DW083_20590 [Parabacteroides sp. AF48-14]